MVKNINKIPNKEKRWTLYKIGDKEYITTSDLQRTTYYLYEHKIGSSEFIKLGKAKDPITLEKKFIK